MIQTGNFKFIRNLNEQIVLNLIRKYNIISSTELVNYTGMRPSTIFNILKELSAKSLVLNVGKGDSTEKGGKKPYLWKLNNTSAYIVGLDIEITKISSVVLNLEGKVLVKNCIKHEKLENVDELVNLIEKNVSSIIELANIEFEKVIGIGIALPAIVNTKEGIVIRTDVLSDQNIPLINKLSNIYEIPVYIENNANATAVGAKWAGVARGCKNFLVVLIEFDKGIGGLGIGIMIDENIYRGSTNCAGEINIPIMNLDQMLIYFRHELGNSPFLKDYDSKPDELEVEVLIQAAISGDKIAIELFKRVSRNIGKLINQAVALLNPDTLVIAGTIAELDDLITEPIRDVILNESIPFIGEKLKIRTSFHGPYSVAVGGACLILSDFFRIPIVKKSGSYNGFASFEKGNGGN
jgi:predicted NBD/HSP70 family sugar kinase